MAPATPAILRIGAGADAAGDGALRGHFTPLIRLIGTARLLQARHFHQRRIALRADHVGRQMAACQYRQHAVFDSGRQRVRPLVNGLIRDAYRLGSQGGCSAEKFNRFCLSHAVLNHSSGKGATIVLVGNATCERGFCNSR